MKGTCTAICVTMEKKNLLTQPKHTLTYKSDQQYTMKKNQTNIFSTISTKEISKKKKKKTQQEL